MTGHVATGPGVPRVAARSAEAVPPRVVDLQARAAVARPLAARLGLSGAAVTVPGVIREPVQRAVSDRAPDV